MASSSKKLGFLDLPLEIRDMIYAYTVHERIIVKEKSERYFPSRFAHEILEHYRNPLGILSTSKAVRAEASRFFFSKATFCFGPWLLMHAKLGFTQHEIDMIKNVEFFPPPPGTCLGSQVYSDKFTKLSASNIRCFGGDEIRRQTCKIHIDTHQQNIYAVGREPWLRAITSLVGFETVILKTRSPRCPCCPMTMEDYLRKTFAGLGPCAVSNDGTTLNVEFHPYKNIAGCT